MILDSNLETETKSINIDKNQISCETLPEELWELLPNNAEYLKNIMKFSGYETFESVIRLQNKDEIQKMFDFVIMMKSVVENSHEMFGIFSTIPEKVMILPGLVPVFEKFIQSVQEYRSLKNPKIVEKKVKEKEPKKPSVLKKCQTFDDVKNQMDNWMLNQNIKLPYKIEATSEPSVFLFTCLSCGWIKCYCISKWDSIIIKCPKTS